MKFDWKRLIPAFIIFNLVGIFLLFLRRKDLIPSIIYWALYLVNIVGFLYIVTVKCLIDKKEK